MNRRQINNLVNKLKLKRNEIVMLHGDAGIIAQISIKNFKENLNFFFEKIIEKIGSEGTILVPTFTYSFIKKKFFHVSKSKSEVGLFSEKFRLLEKVYRYNHPIFSFAVFGKKFYPKENYSSCFGKKTIFEFFYRKNGRIIVLGNAFEKTATFNHFIEESCKVKYRYYKNFYGLLIDNREKKKIKISYYVRDLNKDTKIKKKKLIYKHLIKEKFKRFFIYSINSKKLFKICQKEIKKNHNFLITNDI